MLIFVEHVHIVVVLSGNIMSSEIVDGILWGGGLVDPSSIMLTKKTVKTLERRSSLVDYLIQKIVFWRGSRRPCS